MDWSGRKTQSICWELMCTNEYLVLIDNLGCYTQALTCCSRATGTRLRGSCRRAWLNEPGLFFRAIFPGRTLAERRRRLEANVNSVCQQPQDGSVFDSGCLSGRRQWPTAVEPNAYPVVTLTPEPLPPNPVPSS